MDFLRNILKHLKSNDSCDENIHIPIDNRNSIDSNSCSVTDKNVNDTNNESNNNNCFELELRNSKTMNFKELKKEFNNTNYIDVNNNSSDKTQVENNKEVINDPKTEISQHSKCTDHQKKSVNRDVLINENLSPDDFCDKISNTLDETTKVVTNENIALESLYVHESQLIDSHKKNTDTTSVERMNRNIAGGNLPQEMIISLIENNHTNLIGTTVKTSPATNNANTLKCNIETVEEESTCNEFKISCVNHNRSEPVNGLDQTTDDIIPLADITDLADSQNMSEKSILDISLQEFSDNEGNYDLLNEYINPMPITERMLTDKIQDNLHRNNVCSDVPLTVDANLEDFEECIQMFILKQNSHKRTTETQENANFIETMDAANTHSAIKTHDNNIINISSDDPLNLSQTLNDLETISISSEESKVEGFISDLPNDKDIIQDTKHSVQHISNVREVKTTDSKIDNVILKDNISETLRFDDYDSDGYNSSDFEFITEEEASKITNSSRDNDNDHILRTMGIRENFDKCGSDLPEQDIHNNDIAVLRYPHIVPEGNDFLNLFSGLYMPPIPYMFENKSIRPSTMHVPYEGVGFDMKLLLHKNNTQNSHTDKESDKLREEAEANSRKILNMYPSENGKRLRKF